MMSGVAIGAPKTSSRAAANKKLIIDEFKRRLRDNIKSLSDNFYHIIQVAKVSAEDDAYKNQTGKMAEFYTTKNEMAVRSQLMIRACDELLKLTSDLKEFLILHDFHYLTQNIKEAEAQCEETLKDQSQIHSDLEFAVSNLIQDLDYEIGENFHLRHD